MSSTPFGFQIHARPAGVESNRYAPYRVFPPAEAQYSRSTSRMDEELLERYVRQYIEAQPGDVVTFAWRGGEPLLAGLEFFQRAVMLAKQHASPGVTVEFTLETNGTLLDGDWCEFLRENAFLVGLSIDGPRTLQDTYSVDTEGSSAFVRGLRAARLLREHRVDYNILTSVHASNGIHPLEVYHFLRDGLGATWIQFMPVVERIQSTSDVDLAVGTTISDRSITSEEWGRFLIAIFDEWVRNDVGSVYVNMFESALAAWLGLRPEMCILRETCGDVLMLEHNGDLYSCEHFAEPAHFLGNITQCHLYSLVKSQQQQEFGEVKRDLLPKQCRTCPVRFACHGECPKNRFVPTSGGEPYLNYLCAGYLKFFTHIDRPMRIMAQLYRMGRAPAEVMAILAAEDGHRRDSGTEAEGNALRR